MTVIKDIEFYVHQKSLHFSTYVRVSPLNLNIARIHRNARFDTTYKIVVSIQRLEKSDILCMLIDWKLFTWDLKTCPKREQLDLRNCEKYILKKKSLSQIKTLDIVFNETYFSKSKSFLFHWGCSQKIN